jgi:alkylation response protein AidB-like acyl-CoA dehydrogenase
MLHTPDPSECRVTTELDPTLPPNPVLDSIAGRARAAAGDVAAALELARALGEELPLPGRGSTTQLWSALATLGAVDLTVARVVEPHLDALAILHQAGETPAAATWGVYAAEGPGEPLRAEAVEAGASGAAYVLRGRKHWCSLAGVLDRALVSAWVGDERQLFDVDLQHPGARAVPGTWVARGLSSLDSGPLDLDEVPARPVGEPGWYLERPGFAWGGIGVAAVWWGGAVGVARRVRHACTTRGPDQLALAHLGAVDAALHAGRGVLVDAAKRIDAGLLDGGDGWQAALRARQVVAEAAETVLRHAAHALGPGPLATEEEHAARVADLELYLRQWHAERDQAALGALVLEHGSDW